MWRASEPWVVAVRDLAAPGALIAEVSDWAALLDRHSAVEVAGDAQRSRILWENVHGYDPDARECAFRLGALLALLNRDSSTAEIDVRHARCRARGDERCAYEVQGVPPDEDLMHAKLLYECSVLSAALQGREAIWRHMASFSARSGPFPDVRDMRAVRRFMEEIEDPVLVLDQKLDILDVNRAGVRMAGMGLNELRGLSARELMSAESFRVVQQTLPILLEAGALRGLVIEARTRRGWIPMEVSARVSENKQTMVAIARDVSEHRRLKRELEERNRELREQNERISEADRLKSEFLANVSHELTTPLTSIKGFSKLLVSDFSLELEGGEARLSLSKRIEFVSIVQQEAERMTELIRSLLELSKIESGALSLDRARVSLNAIVRESLLVVKPRLDDRALSLEARLDESLPLVPLDPDRIKQVVLNLLDNAVKFSDPGSEILVRTARLDDAVRLSVRNPCGELEPGDLGRIFERFIQRDGSFARSYGGVGLGLNLVRGIVQLHGGRIWAELPAPGLVEIIAELPILPA